MATDIHPIGFLSSVGGNRHGLGENYVKKLDAAGKPSITFTNDDFGGIADAIALINNGSKVPHICVFRVVKRGDEAFAVPKYALSPKDAAEEFKNRIQPSIPDEVKKNRQHIWILVGNELDETRADWLGFWSYESALLWNAEGYKIATVGWNSGEPKDPEAWKEPGLKKYLTYCGQHPDKAAVNVHEYSFIKSDILHEYPWKVGRFQFLYKACDEMGIPRVPLLVGEWGWEKDHVPDRDQARREIRDVANLYSQFPQILGAGIWYLGAYQRGSIANETQRLIKPIGEDAANYQSGGFSRELIIDPAAGVTELVAPTPPGEIQVDDEAKESGESKPITSTKAMKLFELDFTGWGERDVAKNPSLAPATWYDHAENSNVQVPIIGGKKMKYWEAEGKNAFSDGKPWNDFSPTEGVHRWDAFLPQHEHYFLNEKGRCYHLFAPSKAWWARFYHTIQLVPGTYRLRLDLWGDWVDIVNGKKQPKKDPQHARVELFLGEQGLQAWQIPNFDDQSILQSEIKVDQSGKYDVGFGILTVFAPGGGEGANGCWLRSFTLERIDVQATKPQSGDIAGREGTRTPAGDVMKRPSDVGGSLSSEEVQLDASLEAVTKVDSSGLAEVSRQVIVLSDQAGADVVQLRLSQQKGDQWQLQTSLSKRLESDLRLEIVFLRGSDETGSHIADEGDQDRTDQADTPDTVEKAPTTPDSADKPGTTAPLLGMDVSLHRGKKVDFQKAAAAGVRFCYIRAGSSKTRKDPNFDHNFAEAGKAGMLRGIYYYQYPESEAKVFDDPADKTPEGQARRFAGLLEKEAELGAVLDVEQAGLPLEEVKRFVDAFQKHDPYERPITIYTSWGFWSKPNGYAGKAVEWASKHPLWVAHHTHGKKLVEPTDQFKVLFPRPWKQFGVHQWTRFGGSIVDHVDEILDLNYFAGSETDLLEWSRTGVFAPRAPVSSPPEKPKKKSLDLLDYIKGDGRQYEVKSENGDEHFQVQEDGKYFYLVKNRQWEQFFYDDEFIYRDADTSPGGGRYYRQKDADLDRGSRWIRRNMAIGDIFVQSKNVQFYKKKDGSKLDAHSGDVTDVIKLAGHHKKIKFRTGFELEDVIEMHWLKSAADPTPKEKYFFARSYGLVGWARGHEDVNSPSSSAIAELSSPGRTPEKREKVTGL